MPVLGALRFIILNRYKPAWFMGEYSVIFPSDFLVSLAACDVVRISHETKVWCS